jgi:hypothetical protein
MPRMIADSSLPGGMAARAHNPVAALRRFARPRTEAAVSRAESEWCELCSAKLQPTHRHLLEMKKREVICVCDPCAMRFQDVVGGRFKLIPRDPRLLPEFHLTNAQWESLALPIDLAFFFFSTPLGKMTAMYPSPAGATESLLPLTAWTALLADNPVLGNLEADVEALLVNRVGESRESFLAPIDACYGLVGLIRMHWRGLSGGEAVWQEIARFFSGLKQRARTLEGNHA